VINLSSTQTFAELEKALKKIEAPGVESLLLPTDASMRGLWSRAMLIQTVVTWARRHPGGDLLGYTDFEARENLIEKIVRREHGLVAALMASRVSSNEHRVDRTGEFKQAALERLRQLQVNQSVAKEAPLLPGFENPNSPGENNGVARRGTVALTLSADGLGALAFPRQFYVTKDGKQTVREADDFGDWILAEFTHERKGEALRFKRPNLPRLRLLGRCLAELFSNTHKFARTTIAGATLPRSVRGILTDAIKDAGVSFDPAVEPTTIQSFLRTLPERFGPRAGVIEISIFDSGPGMASHWLGRSLGPDDSLTEENTAILSCLQKWGTRGGDESRGLGLHKVMEILSSPEVGGMLFVRTGRLALIRNLHAEPLDVTPGAADRLETYRMTPLFGEERLARVEGTLVSLVIPAPTEVKT
jgi:hypothetical protein